MKDPLHHHGPFQAILHLAPSKGEEELKELRAGFGENTVRWSSERWIPSHQRGGHEGGVEVTLAADNWAEMEQAVQQLKIKTQVLKARVRRLLSPVIATHQDLPADGLPKRRRTPKG